MFAASTSSPPPSRRPLATRNAAWARALARGLAKAGVRPNAISFASLLFAGFGAWTLYRLGSAAGSDRLALALASAAAIQLRLLMNLLLLRAGYPPAIVHSTERQRYYDALKGSLPTIVTMVSDSITNGLQSIEKLLDDYERKGT